MRVPVLLLRQLHRQQLHEGVESNAGADGKANNVQTA